MGSPATASILNLQMSERSKLARQYDSGASLTNRLRRAVTLTPSLMAATSVLVAVAGGPAITQAQAPPVEPNERLTMLFGDLARVAPLQIITPGRILDDVKFLSIQESTVFINSITESTPDCSPFKAAKAEP